MATVSTQRATWGAIALVFATALGTWALKDDAPPVASATAAPAAAAPAPAQGAGQPTADDVARPFCSAARSAVHRADATNADVAHAKALMASIPASSAGASCIPEALTSIDQTSRRLNPEPAKTLAQKANSSWDDFYKTWVSPAWEVLLPALTVLAFLLVLSTLLTRLVPVDADGWSLSAVRRGVRGAVAALVVASVAVTFVWDVGSPWAWRTAVLAAVVAVAAVLLLAWASGRAFRCEITFVDPPQGDGRGDGSDGASAAPTPASGTEADAKKKSAPPAADPAAEVVAAVWQLADTRPRGVTVAEAVDGAGLPDAALSALPSGAVASALKQVARAALPLRPWRVQVTPGADRYLVQFTRNGKLSTLQEIRLDVLSPSLTKLDPSKRQRALALATAAVIVVWLSRFHDELKNGLNGATAWTSVARHLVATDGIVAVDDATRSHLFQRAVDADTENLAARLALCLDRESNSTDIAERIRQFEQLKVLAGLVSTDDGAPSGSGNEALNIRIQYALLASVLNISVGGRTADERARFVARARGRLMRLDQARKDQGDRTEHLRNELKALWPLLEVFVEGSDDDLPATSEVTSAVYAKACLLAERASKDGPKAKQHRDEALRLLQQAIDANPWLGPYARHDPYFATLLEKPDRDFLKAVYPPSKAFTALAPFEKFPKLADLQIVSAGDVIEAAKREEGKAFADAVDASPVLVDLWVRLATLYNQLELEDPSMCALLLDEDVRSEADLHRELRNPTARKEFGRRLAGAATKAGRRAPSRSELEGWARRLGLM